MQGHIATFSSPIRWLKAGAKAIRQNMFGMICVTMVYIFTMSVLGSLPFGGLVAAAIFMPFGTMLIVRATKDAYEGRTPTYGIVKEMVTEPSQRSRQIRLGLIYAAFLLAANFAYSYLALEDMRQWQVANNRLVWSSVWAHMPWAAIIVAFCIFVAGQMATWFAPMLIGWKNMTVGKAVFYSFFGCLHNWMACTVLAIIIGALTVVCGIGSSFLLLALGMSEYSMFVMAPLAFFISALSYGTIWPMWIDIYGDIAVEIDD